MINPLGAIRVGAFCQHVQPLLRPAPFHGMQGLFVTGQNNVLVLLKKRFFKCIDDGREEDHFLPPQ